SGGRWLVEQTGRASRAVPGFATPPVHPVSNATLACEGQAGRAPPLEDACPITTTLAATSRSHRLPRPPVPTRLHRSATTAWRRRRTTACPRRGPIPAARTARL